MNSFVYDIPTKVYFGSDQLGHLGDELKRFGNRVLLTYGGGSIKKTGLYDRVTVKSAGRGWSFSSFRVSSRTREWIPCARVRSSAAGKR